MTQNGQFCLICNFSNLFHQSGSDDSEWAISPDLQLFQSFPPQWLRITQNGQFHPICNFSNLFPPQWLRMTCNGQFCPIYNFSHLLPPKCLIFGEMSKFFIPGGGGISVIVLSFSNFLNRFTPE